RGEALPTEKQEEAWIKSLERMYPRELSDLERLFTKKIQLCQSPEGKSVYRKRLKIVQDRILGGPVEDKAPPKPAHVDQRPAMSSAEMQKHWAAAKQSLPRPLQKNTGEKPTRIRL
ncbi:MAG: hypothetical protein KGL39_25945, partial [Patescibacteria group bacterium]|nr:hypothetical protein [Patescibacteria group bacterium]